MAYGHAERNLALIRQLEAETRQLLESLDQPDSEHSAWLREGGLSGGSGTAAHPADRLVGGNAVPVGELPRPAPEKPGRRSRCSPRDTTVRITATRGIRHVELHG